MKIRNRRLVAAAGWLGSRAVRGLVRTLRYEYRPLGPDLSPTKCPPGDRLIYTIWHENLMLPAVAFGCPDIAVLISGHADGQILGSLIGNMGMGMVKGSTTRDAVRAVRQLIGDAPPWRHLAVTPDGPRGPRRVVQQGIIYVAAKTGMKIVPSGISYGSAWRAKSWDRFAVPKPYSRARLVTAEPISVPPDVGTADLEPYRLRVQAEMDRLAAVADHWVETGTLEPAVTAPPAPLRLAS